MLRSKGQERTSNRVEETTARMGTYSKGGETLSSSSLLAMIGAERPMGRRIRALAVGHQSSNAQRVNLLESCECYLILDRALITIAGDGALGSRCGRAASVVLGAVLPPARGLRKRTQMTKSNVLQSETYLCAPRDWVREPSRFFWIVLTRERFLADPGVNVASVGSSGGILSVEGCQ